MPTVHTYDVNGFPVEILFWSVEEWEAIEPTERPKDARPIASWGFYAIRTEVKD